MTSSEDFLTRYMDFAVDGFCPKEFHYWSGLSTLAGALENKVCFWATPTWKLYANIYVLLLSHPGMGKSTGGGTATKLLKQIRNQAGNAFIRVLPQQISEAQIVGAMQDPRVFDPRTVNQKGPMFKYSAGYFWASEASNTLKSIHGDFISCLTDWYDCPSSWHRSIKAEGGGTPIPNLCFNLLAGCTYDFLSELIPRKSVGGGFASRLFYVTHDESWTRAPSFGAPQADKTLLQKKEQWLVSRLNKIASLYGQMTCTPCWIEAANELWGKIEKERIKTNSQEKRNFLARKHTNAFKISMLLSVSESCDMQIKGSHLRQAVSLVEALEVKLSKVMSISRQGDSDQTEITGVIYDIFQGNNLRPIHKGDLMTLVLNRVKGTTTMITNTLDFFYTSHIAKVDADGRIHMLVDPSTGIKLTDRESESAR